MNKVLIVNAHQRYENFAEGKLNITYVEMAKDFFESKGMEVKITEIEKGYDPAKEMENHLWADLVILQTPVYWMNTPWIYKKYADEVFMAGLFAQKMVIDDGRTRKNPAKQYGTGGLMQGKKFMLSTTWNAPEKAFNDENQLFFEGKAVKDVFFNVSLNYKFCGMEILPDFSCFDVLKNPDVTGDFKRFKEHLASII